ncbi:MAG: hypothetical protein K0S76_864 [Herbinix sp.]|jgi:hypothetical protein|nr:hypothetical protein [Herbinix sp.]
MQIDWDYFIHGFKILRMNEKTMDLEVYNKLSIFSY